MSMEEERGRARCDVAAIVAKQRYMAAIVAKSLSKPALEGEVI